MSAPATPPISLAGSRPQPYGSGSVRVAVEHEETGRPIGLCLQLEVGSALSSVPWFPPNAIPSLQAALGAIEAVSAHVPRAEEYLEGRSCPACNGPLLPGEAPGGRPCYECADEARGLRAHHGAWGEDL